MHDQMLLSMPMPLPTKVRMVRTLSMSGSFLGSSRKVSCAGMLVVPAMGLVLVWLK